MHNKMQSKLPVKWIIIYHPKFQFTIPQKKEPEMHSSALHQQFS